MTARGAATAKKAEESVTRAVRTLIDELVSFTELFNRLTPRDRRRVADEWRVALRFAGLEAKLDLAQRIGGGR